MYTGKPEWCPPEIWEAAKKVSEKIDGFYVRGMGLSDEQKVLEAIAEGMVSVRCHRKTPQTS